MPHVPSEARVDGVLQCLVRLSTGATIHRMNHFRHLVIMSQSLWLAYPTEESRRAYISAVDLASEEIVRLLHRKEI